MYMPSQNKTWALHWGKGVASQLTPIQNMQKANYCTGRLHCFSLKMTLTWPQCIKSVEIKMFHAFLAPKIWLSTSFRQLLTLLRVRFAALSAVGQILAPPDFIPSLGLFSFQFCIFRLYRGRTCTCRDMTSMKLLLQGKYHFIWDSWLVKIES